jgi:hypothetical protein
VRELKLARSAKRSLAPHGKELRRDFAAFLTLRMYVHSLHPTRMPTG